MKRRCGWCTGPPGAEPPHCYGKRPTACFCACTKTKRRVVKVKKSVIGKAAV